VQELDRLVDCIHAPPPADFITGILALSVLLIGDRLTRLIQGTLGCVDSRRRASQRVNYCQ